MGRFITETVAQKIYEISDTSIIIKNNKPMFENSDIKFSVSHSQNLVAVAFSENECGLDIEEMKPRNLMHFEKRYNRNFISIEDFYKFWTGYEAEIKLQKKAQAKYSCILLKNFMLTVASESNIKTFSIENLMTNVDF